MTDNESRKMLYGYLNQKGIYDDEEKFNSEMDTEEGRKALWERMSAGGSPVGWEEFNDNLKPTLQNSAANEKQQAQDIAAVKGNNAVANVSTEGMQVNSSKKAVDNNSNANAHAIGQSASGTIAMPEMQSSEYTITPVNTEQPTQEDTTTKTRSSGLAAIGDGMNVDTSLLNDQRYRNDKEVHDVLFPKIQSAIDRMISENEQKGNESADAVAKELNKQNILPTQGNAMFQWSQQEAAKRRETDPQLIINSINRMYGISAVTKTEEERKQWLKDNNVTVVKQGGKLYYKYNNMGGTMRLVDAADNADTEFMNDVSKMAYKQAGLDFMNKPKEEQTDSASTVQSEPLSEEEIKLIEQRYGRRFNEIIDVLNKDIWNYLKQQYNPEGWADYVLGDGLKQTVTARLINTLIDRAANDSGIREQLRAEAQEDYLESLGDWGGMFTGALHSVVSLTGDAPIFGLAGLGGEAVGMAGAKLLGRGISRFATKSAMKYVSKAITSGWMFGNYDVMNGAVTQLAQDKFDLGELAWDWAGGFATGAVLGGTNEKIDRIANDVASRFGKAAVHVGGYAAEVGLFTGQECFSEIKNYAQQMYKDDWYKHLDDAASDLGWGKFGKILGRQAAMIGMLKGKEWLKKQMLRTDMLKANNMLTAEMMEELEPYKGMLSGKKLNKEHLQQVRELRDMGQSVQIDASAEERLDMWKKMMADPNVSAVAKNAATFIMFGERGNINPVTSVDEPITDKNGVISVVRRDAQGNIISRKKFRDSTTANAELAKAQHEARLNNIFISEGEVGEISSRTNAAMLQVAKENHISYERMTEIMNGDIQDAWAKRLLDEVRAVAKQMTKDEGIRSIFEIRKDIEDKTGIDINKALRAKNPTPEQINALDAYYDALEEVKQAQTNKATAVSEEVKVTEEAQKEVEKKAEELKPYVSADGKVTKIKIKNKEGEYYVQDYDPDADFIYYINEDGVPTRENWDNVEEYNTIDYNDYMNEMQNGLHEAAKKEAQHEAEQHEEETPVVCQTGQVVNVGAKGEQYRVIGYDENGNVRTERIEVKNNGMTIVRGENPPMSEADLKSMMDENQRLKKEAQEESVKKGVVVEPEDVVKQREEDMKAVKAGSEFGGTISGRKVTVKVLDVDEMGNCEVEILTEGAEPVHDIVKVGEVRKMMESANAGKVPEAPEAPKEPEQSNEPEAPEPPVEPVAPVGPQIEPETPEPKKSAYDSIPEEVDEKTGKAKKVYTRATVEETRNALLEKYGQDEDGKDIVSTVANDMIADAEERMNKAKGDPDAKAAAYREKKYWERVRDFDAQEKQKAETENAKVEGKKSIDNALQSVIDNYDREPMTFAQVDKMITEDINNIQDEAVREEMRSYWNNKSDEMIESINRKYWQKYLADRAEEMGNVKNVLDSMNAEDIENMLLDLGVDQNYDLNMEGAASGFKNTKIYKRLVEDDSSDVGGIIDEIAAENKKKRDEWRATQAAMKEHNELQGQRIDPEVAKRDRAITDIVLQIQDMPEGRNKTIAKLCLDMWKNKFDTMKELVDNINRRVGDNVLSYTQRMADADNRPDEARAQAREGLIQMENERKNRRIENDKIYLTTFGIDMDKKYSPAELLEKFKPEGAAADIWEIIKNVANKLNIQIEFRSKDADANLGSLAGYFDPNTGKIVIAVDTLHNERNASEAFVHETVHSLTTKIINMVLDGKVEGLTKKQIDAVKNLNKLYQSFKNDNNLSNKYPVKDIYEFIAHLSNEELVKELRAKDRNFLQKIFDYICDIIGIDNANDLARQYLRDIISDGTYLAENGISSWGKPQGMTSEELFAQFGQRWIEEQENEDGRHSTQVEKTLGTYKKIGNFLEEESGHDLDILDASSGLGLGTEALRDMGFRVEDVEPYPSNTRKAPTYLDYNDINKKYDVVISNAVLNVIPDDWRRGVLHQMAACVKTGGRMIINVRPASDIIAQKNKIELDDPSEILVLRGKRISAYQKGFTHEELSNWIKEELGENWIIDRAKPKNSGISGMAVVVTKVNDDVQGMGFSNNKEDRKKEYERAKNEKGFIVDGVLDKDITIVDVKRHDFAGRFGVARNLARQWGIKNLVLPDDKLVDERVNNVDNPYQIILDNRLVWKMGDGTPYKISVDAVKKFTDDSSMSNSDNAGVQMAVLKQLPEVIYNSIDVEKHPDYIKNEDGRRFAENGTGESKLVHRMYGAVRIDGKLYRVKTTMNEFLDGSVNIPHTYEVTQIELLGVLHGTANNGHDITALRSNNSISAANLLYNVEKSHGNGKKLFGIWENSLDSEDKYEYLGGSFGNYKGSKISRGYKSKDGKFNFHFGKWIGNQLYVHKKYTEGIVKRNVEKAEAYLPEGFKYNCVVWDKDKPNLIRFDEAPDFDTSREPVTGKYVWIDADTGHIVKQGKSPQIWHHKWAWVGNNYKGFDVKKAYDWSRIFSTKIKEKPKGSSKLWEEQLNQYDLPLDEDGNRFREDAWRTENGFYSPAEKAVIDVKQEKATGEQWIKMIEKAGGLKKEEDKWMGLSDFLKGKKSVTKEEVLRFIRQNSIYIKDINYAEKGNMNDEAAVKEQIFNSSTWEGLMEDLIEYDENDNPYVNREAFKRLQNESNDFYNGFSIDYWGEEIEIDDANAAARYLGLDVDHAINDTRLNYTTDGLQNKREIALVVPSVEPYEGSLPEIHFTDEATGGKTVAWIRFGETTDSEGKRVLVIDEIQSQRHQDGREQGYTSDYDNSARAKFRQATEAMNEFNRKMKEKYGEYHVLEDMTPEEQAEYEKLYKAQTEASQYDAEEEKLYNVPDAPFQKNWQELAMKRMLRYAAENGYDKVAWTDGRTQTQRYGLEKELNSIFVYRAVDPITGEQIPDKYDVSSYDRGDREVMSACGRMDRAKMIKLFGKELGNKLADESDAHEKGWANIEFKDQKFYVGGDGMKGFYDDMLPRWMNKYGKKWGIKVESELMEGLSDHESDYHVKGEDRKWGLNMWTVPVTEEMKSSVMGEGQSMWRGKDNETAKAQSGKATGGWDINNEDENIKHIEEAVTENAKRINVKVNVVRKEDLKNFSEKIQTKLRRGGKGWFNPKTGEIFVYVENANNVGDAVKTVLHEAVGHKGLRELFGADQYDNVMKDLHKQMPADVQEEINKLAKDKYKGDIAYAMDEYLANKAQEGVTPTWWGKVVGAFRSILKNVFGRDIELTDGDIKYLLWRSYKGLRGEHDMFDLADDVAMRFKNKIGEYAEKIGEIRDDVVFAGNVIKSKNFKNWFGDWEKDPEHASKVVDDNGKPQVVYHGTKSGEFYIFDQDKVGQTFGNDKEGFFFDEDLMYARDIYLDSIIQPQNKTRVFECYLNIKKPLFIDAKWAKEKLGIDVDGLEPTQVYDPNNEFILNEFHKGDYDGIIVETGENTFGGWQRWHRIYIVFRPEQIKSASEGDKMQNNGDFDPKNPDIRFQQARSQKQWEKIDKEYMDAVNAGDMEKAKMLVEDAAELADYTSGTDYQGGWFNGAAPSSNAYFETKEERKEAFDKGEMEGDMSLGDYVDNGIDCWDLDWQLKNPRAASYDAANAESIANLRSVISGKKRTIKMYRAVDASIGENGFRNGDWITPSKKYAETHIAMQSWEKGRIIEEEVNIDDIWWNGDSINEWGFDDGNNYAYKNTANNRKLMDAVTYDDEGNVIPLSKRFNQNIKDERFAGEGDKSLIGVHNIGISQLKKALNMGGLANPSTAIIDVDKMGHERYGEISLVMPKSLVDSKTGNHGGTHGADIYSPDYPTVYTRFSDKDEMALKDKVYELGGEHVGDMNVWGDFISRLNNGQTGGLEYIYAKQKGADVDSFKHLGFDSFWEPFVTKYQDGFDLRNAMMEDPELMKQINDYFYNKEVNDNFKLAKNKVKKNEGESKLAYWNRLRDMSKKIASTFFDEDGMWAWRLIDREFDNQKEAYYKNGDFDQWQTRNKVSDFISDNQLHDDYAQWEKDLIAQFNPKEQLYAGTDSKTGEQKYVDNNLKNASMMMKKQGKTNTDGFFKTSMGGVRAEFTPLMKTLKEIRDNKWRLDKEKFEEQREIMEAQYTELANLFHNGDSYDFNTKYYNLIDALKSGNAKKWADKNGFDISEEDGKLIDNFAIALKEMPTEYFELKFERPVGFNEFSGAVVPKSLDAETKKALEDNGLKLFEYDPEVEGDRQRALTEASDEDDVRFRFVGEYGKRDDEEAMKSLELAKQMEKDDWKSPDMEMSMEEKKALGLDKGGEFAKYISDQKKRRIKKATGWERGRDGKWRYETPDFEGKISFNGDAQIRDEDGFKRWRALHKRINGFALGLNEDITPEEKAEYNELRKKYAKGVSTWQKTDKLPKFIKDDELFKMYPELANVELSFKAMADGEKGVLIEPTIDELLDIDAPPFKIVLNDRLTEEEATSVLAHEIQHAIQAREGFAKGGNVESSIPKLKEIKRKMGIPDDEKCTISLMKSYLDYIPQSKYNELLDEALNNNYSSVEDWIDSLNPYTYYHNLAGEVEARNVQDRMHMTPEERRNSLASDTEKVSREKQIVDFGGSGTSGLILGEKGAQTLDEFEKSRAKKLRWIESMEKALGRYGKEDMKEERERWERRFDDDGEQRMKNLKVAIRMAKKRRSAKDIKLATGWEQGKDNKWRYEIGDAKMNKKAKSIITNATDDIDGAVYLPHIIDAPELYEALPALKDVMVRFYSDKNSDYYGMCQGKYIWINLAEYLKTKGRAENLDEADRNGLLEFAMSEIESTFNHEIQHQIQSVEGFADGGNIRDVRKLLKNIIDNKEWDNEEDKRRIEQHAMLISDAYGIESAKQLFRNPKRFLKWQKSYEYNGNRKKVIEAGQKWAVEQYWSAMDHIIRDAENWGVDLAKLGFDVDRFNRLLPLSHPDVTAKEGFMIDEAIKVYKAIVKASSKQLTADQSMEKVNRYEAVENAIKNVFDDYELYKRLAGEVEARAVSKRMGMTAEERRNKPIQSDEDVKRQDQIAVRWFGDQLMGEQSEDDGIRFRDGDDNADKKKKRVNKGSRKERSRRLIEDGAIDWQDYVLMSMGGGAKFKWDDKEDGTKGLGSHTTGKDSKLQKKSWRKYIDEKNGEVPEDMAHRIWESMPEEMKERCTDQDVFNEIIDNVRSFDTYEDMLTASEKAHFDKENEDKERAIADEMDRYAQSMGFNTYEEFEAAERDAYAKKQGYDNYAHMMQERMDMWAQNNGYNDYAQYKEQTEAQERASAEIARQQAERQKRYDEALIQNRIEMERDRVFRKDYLQKQAMQKWLKSKGYENEQDYYAHKRLLAQQSREVERKRAARQRRIEKDLANAGERMPLPPKPDNAKMGSDKWYQWIDEIAAVKEHNRNYDKLHPQEAMDRNEAMRQVRERINEGLKSDSVTEMDKRTLNSMLRTLSNADATNIEESLEEANRLVNHLLLKNKRKAVEKLLDLKVQDQNNKGVSVAKNVDDDTRNLFSKLKMTAKDTVSSGLEDKIHDLRSENWHLNEEMKRTDDVSRIAEIENKIEENKQQIVELSEKRRKVLAEKVQTTSESIQKKIDDLKEAMQEKEDKMLNNANYEGTIEPDKKDIITLTALEIQKMIADSANTDSDIFKMEASKREFVSAKMALWDEYKEKLDEARTRMESAQPNTAEQAEAERIYKAMVDEYKAKKHGLELRINGLTNLIVEAQRQQVDNIDKLYEVLDEQYRGGKDALLANVENMQKRRLNFISEAMHVVRGSGKRVNIETVDKEQGKESIVKKAFTAALSSFDYLSQAIATRTGGEDNWIHNHFMYAKDGVQAAWNTLIEGKRLAKNELDSSISEIFANYRGGKTNRKKITDFNSWWKEMDKKPKDGKYGKEHGIYNPNGEYATTGITVMDMNDVDMQGNPTGARYERAEMTKGQAMYAYMVWKMHDGKSKMQLMGFDDRSITEIEQYIGQENVELSNWIQDEFFANLREKYNAKHKEIYNTSMAAIEHYVPIKILGAARHQDVDLSGDTGNGAGQLVVKTGSIINRTANVLPVDFSYSAAEVIWDHVMQMEEFNAYASVRRDLSWILSCPAFKNQLNTNSAGMFDRFRKAVEVAVKSNKPNGGELDNAVAKLQKPLASSAIAFRNATALKQTLSVPAFFGYSEDPVYWAILTKNIFKGYGRNLPAIAYNMLTFGTQGKKMWKQVEEAKGAYKNALSDDVKWCLKNLPDFWERVSLGVAGDNRLAESFVDVTGQFKGKYAEIGMQANKMVDAVTCAIGAKSVYEYEMSKVDKKIREKEKYTFDADADPELVAKWREEQMKEAENLAKMKAVICYNQSQQSNDPAFMSPMQVSRTFIDRCMSLFKNSPISYARKLYEGMQDSYRTINNYNKVKNEYVRQWLKSNNIELDEATKNDRFEAQKYASNQCRHIIQKGLLNAALGGFILNYLWKEGGEGILGMLDNEDDEEKNAFDYILEYAAYPSQGVLGADLPIALLTSGKWTANMMTGGELEKILGDLKKAYEKYDLFSMEVAYLVTNVGTKFGLGVNLDTWRNIYMGAERMVKSSGDTDEMVIAYMYLMNSPASQRAATAKRLFMKKYGGDEYMNHIDEYIDQVERAIGYTMDADVFESWMPAPKALSAAAENKLYKEFITKNLTPEEQKQAQEIKDFNDKLKDADSIDALAEMLENEKNVFFKEKIINKIHSANKEEHDDGKTKAESMRDRIMGKTESSKTKGEQIWISYMNLDDALRESNIKRRIEEEKMYHDTYMDKMKHYNEMVKQAEEKYSNLEPMLKYEKIQSDEEVVKARDDAENYYKENEGFILAYNDRRELMSTINSLKKQLEGSTEEQQKNLVKTIRLNMDQAVRK